MSDIVKIKSALISVWHKDNLKETIDLLKKLNIVIYSTGGTREFIEKTGAQTIAVEKYTGFPEILGGRVKTLHPKVFGGILARRDKPEDMAQINNLGIENIDLVIVDLYPFEQTVAQGGTEEEITEKIDIGGISLIRAAAKNFRDVLVISSEKQYKELNDILKNQQGETNLEKRKQFAGFAFNISSSYDTAIFNYFDNNQHTVFKQSISNRMKLRYGENPHQAGYFFGNPDEILDKLNGKEISYNNFLDIDAAVHLISEFSEPAFAIIKHNNACGLATAENLKEAWKKALEGDPVSAYGGVLICNRILDLATAVETDKLFFEIIIAPDYEMEVVELLSKKKNRIILRQKLFRFPQTQFKSVMNGVLFQEKDHKTETKNDLQPVTDKHPEPKETEDLIFASIIAKHSKSNTIVLAKNNQLIGSGVGQTSRVDALKHAIEKARSFNFELKGSVMASDAFFPFADSVEIAHQAGITAVIQPGGSVRDQDSINYCNKNGMAMVFTGIRHFKH